MTGNDMTEARLHEKSKRLLDESIASLDSATLSRLHQARSAAIERTAQPEHKWFDWISIGAVAAGLAFVAFNSHLTPLPTIYQDPLQRATAEHMELLDDLDFIAWLVMEEDDFEDVVKSS